MIHTLLGDDRFFVLGHRGNSEMFPENTLASFEDCAEDSEVDGVELDVHRCASGEIVISHDSSLKRTANSDSVIERASWDELKNIDVGSFKDKKFANQHLMLLEDLFSTFGQRFVYDIELKVDRFKNGKKLCLAVWDLIQKYGLEEKVMVSSFNPFALRRFNKACWYSVPTADIFCPGSSVPKSFQKGGGHIISGSSYLKPSVDLLNKGFVNKNNLPLIVWTVNTEQQAVKLLNLKKQENVLLKGMIGNNPHTLAKVLKNYLS